MIGRRYYLICDHCGATTLEDTKGELWDDIRSMRRHYERWGWFRIVFDQWKDPANADLCPDCQDKLWGGQLEEWIAARREGK